MDVEDYVREQAEITRWAVRQVLKEMQPYQSSTFTQQFWLFILRLIFPTVFEARMRSAELGREFYDSQRELHFPDLPPHPYILPDYRLEWFVEAMEPARAGMQKSGTSDYAVERVALRAMKEVENGGRRALLRPVDDEEFRDQKVVGWARIATGRETCAFCLMLVSRGPVYLSADSAGLNMGDTTAADLFLKGKLDTIDWAELSHRWHEGCDCRVVPVFDRANWPGRDAYKRAERIWKETTKGYSGLDAMNAFRRAIERGSVDVQEFAVTKAA